MSRVTFNHPIANISGRLSYDGKIILRTRNGRTQAYVIEHPFKGQLAPERKRTINAFKEAVNQSKTILSDPIQRAKWQKDFDNHKAYSRRHPISSSRRYTTLRGFVIAKLTQQINAQAKQQQESEKQAITTATAETTQTTPTIAATPTTAITPATPTSATTQTTLNALFGDLVQNNSTKSSDFPLIL